MIKVLIVDDHELVRVGIRKLLQEFKEIEVVGDSQSGEDAVAIARDLKPDVVLMDVKMPGIGGLEATKRILRMNPQLKIIVVTACFEEPFPSRLLQAGACGYITKSASPEEVISAIKKVHQGQRYISPEIAQQLALRTLIAPEDTPFDRLSERELQVLLMITNGATVNDIAEKLCISIKTVHSYRYRLFEKLAVQNDVELTRLAIRHGMGDGDENSLDDSIH